MKTKSIFSVVAFLILQFTYCQKPTIELTFSGINSSTYFGPDSIKIMNLNQGCDTVLYYPDTILLLSYQVGIPRVPIGKLGFRVFQNVPNPVENQTTITMFVPEKDNVELIFSDLLGRQIIRDRRAFESGYNSFMFSPGFGNTLFFTAIWKGQSRTIRILISTSCSTPAGSLDIIGSGNFSQQFKTAGAIQSFYFMPGDTLLYIGYANNLQAGIMDSPTKSDTIIFQFASNIPCPGTPTISYEGQVYNTVQIFNQCWLKENLNVGTEIPGGQEMTDDDVLEKYCYDNNTANCVEYGGLYQWNEMMQYSTTQGTQGICPTGWHIPTDEEWKILEGAVDSQHGIGDPYWDAAGYRGFDAGKNLKSTSYWGGGGNGTDMVGFSALPGGIRFDGPYFAYISTAGLWWNSTEVTSSGAWDRYLDTSFPGIRRGDYGVKTVGMSVRCIMDN